MKDWKEGTLVELCTLKRGHDLPSAQRVTGSVPIYSSSGITGYHEQAKCSGPGVIMGRYGTIGEVFFSKNDYWPLNTTLYVENFHGNDEKFIYFFLKTLDWEKFNDKSAVPGINRNDVHKEVISFPEVKEQRAIAAVLSNIDDKIDLLQRQNVTLEAMAEALFIELFINNAGNSEIESITKYINFNPCYSLKKGEVAQFLEMSNLNTNSFHPSAVTQKNFSSGMKFMNKDTLLARITPCLENGKACYVTFLAENEVGWGSTEYIVMRPIAPLHPLFAYCLAKSEDFRGYAENCLQGSSGRQRVDLHHLQQYQINSVTNEKLEKFNVLAEIIEPKLHNNYIQIQTLEKLRDTLLPKLMSGEVRVSLG